MALLPAVEQSQILSRETNDYNVENVGETWYT